MFRSMVEKGVDVNAKDSNNQTALHAVLMSEALKETEKVKLIHCFVENGADVNVQKNSRTALLDAVSEGDTEVAKALIDGFRSKKFGREPVWNYAKDEKVAETLSAYAMAKQQPTPVLQQLKQKSTDDETGKTKDNISIMARNMMFDKKTGR